jgi:hypothetical protein
MFARTPLVRPGSIRHPNDFDDHYVTGAGTRQAPEDGARTILDGGSSCTGIVLGVSGQLQEAWLGFARQAG